LPSARQPRGAGGTRIQQARCGIDPAPHPKDCESSPPAAESAAVNRGDLVILRLPPAGTVLGLDDVGTVAEAAADGSGPAPGSRVMGYTVARVGGWAETAVLDTFLLAPVPG
jgi:NADPH2:quinone reductase